MDKKIKCTMCGKTLKNFDLFEKNNFIKILGYGSDFDLNVLKATLCCNCANKILVTILPLFRTWPLTPYDMYCPSIFDESFLDDVKKQEGLEEENKRIAADKKYLKKLINKGRKL